MKKTILYIIIIALSFACGNKDKTIKTEEVVTKKGILVEDFAAFKNNANTDITSVNLSENVLSLGVSYSGGCQEHEFSLIANFLTK